MTKRIGLLTSGGDCGGLNAVIRAVVLRAASAYGFGVYAVDLVAAGHFDRMVAWQNRRVVDVPLAVAIAMPHCVDPDGTLVRTARGLGICLGDG
jgi:6-phosphofructokinase 1